MLRLLQSLPNKSEKIGVALSGGVDSMVAMDFLLRGGRNPTAFYFNHGTGHGDTAQSFVERFCEDRSVPLNVGTISSEKPSGKSCEEHWRDERYTFFDQYPDHKIVMAHHLDDCLETWLFSTLHGTPKLIPYSRGNIIRPFLLSKKDAILEWADKHSVSYVHDESNDSLKYMRNRIRHRIVPEALKVNPGLHKNVERLLREKYRDDKN